MSAERRVAPLPLLLLLLGVLAFLVLLPSDTAQAQEPPASSGETSGYSGPTPTPPPEHRVPVDWPLIPSGLGPGDSFRLLFLTSTKRNAASGDIQVYIDFVTGRAAAGHASIQGFSSDFRPVISTDGPSNIHAQSVISYSSTGQAGAPGHVPVYWLNGAKVADWAGDFWDNSWDSHAARNERGEYMGNLSLGDLRAWTGSKANGYRNFAAGNSPNVRTGLLRSGDELEDDTWGRNANLRLYAMSPVFTVDHTRSRATFGLVENQVDGGNCQDGHDWYNPFYLTGPAVVYPGHTYTYTFTHNAVKNGETSSGCKTAGAKRRVHIGLVAGTGEVSGNSGRDSADAAWLSTDSEGVVAQADDSALVGKNSVYYRTPNRHRTESHDMSVYIPNNAPRGSTFHIAFFNYSDNSRIETRSGIGNHGWGIRGGEQVELGTVGTVTVAPVPDQPAKPRLDPDNGVGWGPTRNSVRIEFPANDHDGSDRIVNYAIQVSRHLGGSNWTEWATVANVDHGEGTLTRTVTGLEASSSYHLRVWARAKMWPGGRTYYSANSEPLGFQTRPVADPDPPTGFRAEQVFYNRAEVRWWAPSHTGHGPLSRYTIHARRWTGSGWTAWGNAGNPGAGDSGYTVTYYCDGGSHSWCPSENRVRFEPGTHYQLRIEARNRVGTDDSTIRGSAWSEIHQIQTISPVPVAPNKPRISELKATSVKVHWDSLTNDGADEVYSWAVQTRQPAAGGFTPWTTMESPNHDDGEAVQSVVLTGLTPSTYNHQTGQYTASHYQVRVWARARTCGTCKIFYSPGSDERGFDMRTRSPSAPAAPTLSNPGTMPQSIDVSWQPPGWKGEVGAISHYDVYVLVGSDWRISRPTPGSATSLRLTGYNDGTNDHDLEPGTEYRVRVRAVSRVVNDEGDLVEHLIGAWSDPSSFVETLPGAPGAPDAPTVSQVGSGSVTVSWSAPSFAGATAIHDYDLEIRQRQADGTWGAWASSHPAQHGTATSATFTGLNYYGGGDPVLFSPSADYEVRVRANNRILDSGGTQTGTRRGAWSYWTAFRTAPGAPTGLTAIPADSGARLLWTAPSTDPAEVSRYTVEHADNAEFAGSQTVDTTASDPNAGTQAPTELTVTGLTNGTETHFRVRAVRVSAMTDFPGDWSDPSMATPSGPVDYDSDGDGLIEITTLAQLNAVRWDLEGRGQPVQGHEIDYAFAFPVPLEGMGCPPVQGDTGGCRGYELAADLDFDENGDEVRNDTYNQGNGWLPIGDPDNEDATPETYAGVFDGNGHVISNLYVNRDAQSRAGLFDGIASGGVVRDLGLPDADVTGNNGVGALAGVNNGTVRRSWSTGSVEGLAANVGGLVGWNGDGDLIENSWSSAAISGGRSTGGLAGRNKGTVRGSYARGQVSSISAVSGDYIGGLVGWNEGGSILSSYATGTVVGDSNALGGLAGHNSGTVTASYAEGRVNVRAGHSGGGLVGWNNGGSITASYARGTVSATMSADKIGGLVGISENSGAVVTDSYWNTETSGQTGSSGGAGKTTDELQMPFGFTGIYENWNDLDDDDTVDTTTYWDFGTATDYPGAEGRPRRRRQRDMAGVRAAAQAGSGDGPGGGAGLNRRHRCHVERAGQPRQRGLRRLRVPAEHGRRRYMEPRLDGGLRFGLHLHPGGGHRLHGRGPRRQPLRSGRHFRGCAGGALQHRPARRASGPGAGSLRRRPVAVPRRKRRRGLRRGSGHRRVVVRR